IYYEDRRTVSVERNVSFEKHEAVELGQERSQIKGEKRKVVKIDQHLEQGNNEVKDDLPKYPVDPRTSPSPNQTDCPVQTTPLDSEPPIPAVLPRRSTRQWTESPYIWMLNDGVGTHDGRGGEPVLPRSIQGVALEGCRESGGENAATEAVMASSGWEDEDTAYAMYAGVCEAEALEPRTVDEAQKQLDWPR
ncbi:hypothetical protein BDN67DRAFT_874518, partial [Paxillus ammoniavirescens]